MAEDASKAANADDIFEFQQEQNARIFVTNSIRNRRNSDSPIPASNNLISQSTMKTREEFVAPAPKGFKYLDGLEDLIELKSPKGINGVDHQTLIEHISKRNGTRSNNASYIHTLSKKVSANNGKNGISRFATLSSTVDVAKGRKGKISANGVVGTFSPKSGRVLIGISKTKKDNGSIEVEECSGDLDSDDYNQNLSEEEDGDF